jgi:molybdopterin molybdotransferase
MLSVSEALTCVLERAKTLPPLEAAISDIPLGQTLAEDVSSDVDSPPFTKAMMDGYAVRASDVTAVPAVLQVVEEVGAGQVPAKPVGKGEATRIMTGAPIPDGADAVVMIERTETVSPSQVRILAAAKPQQHILARGSEMKSGEVVLRRGARLGPQEFGLLATVGKVSTTIYLKPRVAILTTGNEVVEPPARPGPGQIRNSNGPMLMAQVLRAGGSPRSLGIGRDSMESLRALVTTGLSESDVLILSGGVSAGKYDLVPVVLEELGVTSHFHKVTLKPGKPFLFGTRGEKLVFGLPGNPVSSFVCFELFVRPALRAMSGNTEPGPRIASLPIAARFETDNDRPTYWPAHVEFGPDCMKVRALPWSGSADLRALHGANALLSIPPGRHCFECDSPVLVVLLDE